MSLPPIDPARTALPPVAQFLAEAALQRQASLLGLDKAGGAAATAPRPEPDPTVPPPAPGAPPPPPPVPAPAAGGADKASISAQAREQWLGAGFDPRRGNGRAAPVAGAPVGSGAQSAAGSHTALLSGGALAGAAPPAATAASGAAGWPATGLGTPLMRLVGALVQQVTAGSGAPQRVVSAQPWPVGLAEALERGEADPAQPPLQTWLVRQGTVQTPEGPRGFALTLRVPVPWLAAQPGAPAAAPPPPLSSAHAPAGPVPGSALQVPFTGGATALQSGVVALVLQGMEAAAPRTSALLVLDFQPPLAATVYGREQLQQAAAGRLDPWTQMAVLQASGQVPRDEDRARDAAPGVCVTAGCPYATRAECAQPFCPALRSVVLPPDPVGPAAGA